MISHGSSLAPCARGDGVAAQDCGGTVACTKPRRGTLAKCLCLCPAGDVPPTRASPEALPRRTAAVPPLGGYHSEVGARRMTSKAEESPHDCKPNPGTSRGRPGRVRLRGHRRVHLQRHVHDHSRLQRPTCLVHRSNRTSSVPSGPSPSSPNPHGWFRKPCIASLKT